MTRLAARRTRTACLLLALLIHAVPGTAAATPRIALIIDDLGYELTAGRRAVALPGPVACAVLPGTPLAARIAGLAAASGKDVLLHLPLQAADPDVAPDPGALRLDMTRREFAAAFAANLASVPAARGVSNHRGSLLTRHPGHMTWLMEELSARDGLYFVDSYTTHHSIALQFAFDAGIPAVRRDVFLDNDRSEAGIRREFERLKREARQRGAAVGIGHPYPETLAFLERELPGLAAEGFRLVPVRELAAAAASGAD